MYLRFICISICSFLAGHAAEPIPESCVGDLESMRVGLRHIEGRGIGYNNGYTTLEAFLASPPELWPVMPFMDVRGHLFDNGKWAANAGLGLRGLAWNRVFGTSVYYDYRNTKRQNYNQVSFGLETLGKWVDARVNGYFPVGTRISSPYNLQFDRFAGNNLFVSQKFQYALTGANGELGVHIPSYKDFNFYTAAGPYYLIGKMGTGIWGGEIRLNGNYKNYVTLEVSYSYDRAFKNIVQGQLGINIPFGPKSRAKKDDTRACSQRKMLNSRMLQPVTKNEIIPVTSSTKEEIGIDPSTGQPYTIWFVDNTSHSAGTFESPFATLAVAEATSLPGDIIYVFPGDLTTTGMDTGITLKDNQKLWGSTAPQTLNITLGTLQIPIYSLGQTSTDPDTPNAVSVTPVITNKNTSGNVDVITLANNNEISGLYIQNLTGNGIINPSNCTSLTVLNSIIQGPDTNSTTTAAGINLTNISGTVLIDNNLIFQGNLAIKINNTDISDATYIVSNNDSPSLGDFFVATFTNCSNVSTTVSGGDFNVSGGTIDFTFSNTTAEEPCSVYILDNQLISDSNTNQGNYDEAIIINLFGHANVNFTKNNNTVFSPYANALTIALNNESNMVCDLSDNLSSTWLTSASITLNDSSTFSGSFTNNDLTFDAASGIYIQANNNSTISSLTIENNKIEGVLETYDTPSNCIHVETNQSAIVRSLNIINNNLQAGTNACSLAVNGGSMNASMIDNSVTHCQLYGFLLSTSGSGVGTWTMDDNSITAVSAGSVFGGTTTGSVSVASTGTSITNLSFTNNFSAPIRLAVVSPNPQIGSYQFTQTAPSTFNLLPLKGNTGVITETGTITQVSE